MRSFPSTFHRALISNSALKKCLKIPAQSKTSRVSQNRAKINWPLRVARNGKMANVALFFNLECQNILDHLLLLLMDFRQKKKFSQRVLFIRRYYRSPIFDYYRGFRVKLKMPVIDFIPLAAQTKIDKNKLKKTVKSAISCAGTTVARFWNRI